VSIECNRLCSARSRQSRSCVLAFGLGDINLGATPCDELPLAALTTAALGECDVRGAASSLYIDGQSGERYITEFVSQGAQVLHAEVGVEVRYRLTARQS
jgi:hypothetical protein